MFATVPLNVADTLLWQYSTARTYLQLLVLTPAEVVAYFGDDAQKALDVQAQLKAELSQPERRAQLVQYLVATPPLNFIHNSPTEVCETFTVDLREVDTFADLTQALRAFLEAYAAGEGEDVDKQVEADGVVYPGVLAALQQRNRRLAVLTASRRNCWQRMRQAVREGLESAVFRRLRKKYE